MIQFQAIMTIKNLEKKSFKKKDGGNFDFYEVTCVTDEKKPTVLVARVADEMLDFITVGLKAELFFGISSYEGKDGRIWNNFTLVNKKDIAPAVTPQRMPLEMNIGTDEDIPF